ncbi:MAG TPA: response regulator transcription factor [Chitinophagaceae bacterium]|nr:response regulator transcription factor [Chitinophagaceae bacterium]
MIRMLVADDHPVVRQRLKELLLEGFPSAYLELAVDTASLIDHALNEEWDIIISDLVMPGGGGLHAIKKIKEAKPSQVSILISIYPDEQYASHALSAGATAFLNKNNADNELIGMVNRLLGQVSNKAV